jgi:hypothetical protein
LKLHKKVIGSGVFKRVRSFGESKEKIIKIESIFSQSTIMDVAKEMADMKE